MKTFLPEIQICIKFDLQDWDKSQLLHLIDCFKRYAEEKNCYWLFEQAFCFYLNESGFLNNLKQMLDNKNAKDNDEQN